jgi:hypothetical protein
MPQKTTFFIVTAVKTSNLTFFLNSSIIFSCSNCEEMTKQSENNMVQSEIFIFVRLFWFVKWELIFPATLDKQTKWHSFWTMMELCHQLLHILTLQFSQWKQGMFCSGYRTCQMYMLLLSLDVMWRMS